MADFKNSFQIPPSIVGCDLADEKVQGHFRWTSVSHPHAAEDDFEAPDVPGEIVHSVFQNLDVWLKYSDVPSREHIRYACLQYFASAQIVDAAPKPSIGYIKDIPARI